MNLSPFARRLQCSGAGMVQAGAPIHSKSACVPTACAGGAGPSERRADSGFGLVEVMVSLLVVLLAAAGGIALLMSTIYSTMFSGAAQTASRLGQEIIDRSMAEPFATLGTSTSVCQSTPSIVFGQGTTGGTGNWLQFTRACNMTILGDGMKLVDVTVSWTEKSGRVRTFNMGSQRAP